METNFQFRELPFSTQLAILSFSLGTFILILHCVFPEAFVIMVIGFGYLLMATLINFITLLHVIYLFSKEKNTEDLVIRILLLLSNIPIAILYAYIALHN
ncbi:hypothetical protein [Flavobacterium sp. J27]|uniref:hypothetical protein n=1 Tax=Flavobacterium sp. J27 TaxID=2060419 RepID=UPI00102F4351|nr:hypothetical protein [Flavobacterium sp. J27]